MGRFGRRIIQHVSWERVGAATTAIVAVAALPDAPGLGLMAIVVGCLLAGLVGEAIRMRDFRAEVRSGPTQH